jgi:hypothetical protein
MKIDDVTPGDILETPGRQWKRGKFSKKNDTLIDSF